MKHDIAFCLKVARRKAGLSQIDCAHFLGVHRSRVSLMEHGKILPTVRDLILLSIVYGKPLDALLAAPIADAHARIASRLGTLPPCPRFWIGRFNRHHTLNALAVRLEAMSRLGV